jgi:hypothetical protein
LKSWRWGSNYKYLRCGHHADVGEVAAGYWEEGHEENVGQVGVEEDVGQVTVQRVGVTEQEQRNERDSENKISFLIVCLWTSIYQRKETLFDHIVFFLTNIVLKDVIM